LNVRIDSHGALVASVPALLGFVPTESVVLLLTEFDRPVVTARLDLADAVAGTVQVCSEPRWNPVAANRKVHIVIVAEAKDWSTDQLPYTTLLDQVTGAIARTSLVVADAAWTPAIEALTRWHCYGDRDCGGILPDPHTTPLAVHLDTPIHPSRQALADSLRPEPTYVLQRRADLALVTRPDERTRAVLLLLSAVREAGEGALPCSDGEVVRLAIALADDFVRNWCTVHCHGEHLEGAERLWAALVRGVPALYRAQPATLLAIAAYLRGDGTLAGLALDVAEEVQPGHRMAGLLRAAIAQGISPAELRAILVTADIG
jgi:Domain of unknown function (DUF4192)